MAITFPLARSVFADRLKIAAFRWQLLPFVETSGTGLGQVITSGDRPAPLARRGGARPHAARRSRRDPGADRRARTQRHASICTTRRSSGRATIRAGRRSPATPWRSTPSSDNKALQLAGLPAGYTLRRGDMLHFDYGPSPTRRALHRVVEDATAGPGGTTGFFEVRPFLKAGTTDRRPRHPGPGRGADDARARVASIPAPRGRSTRPAWPSTRSRSADARRRPCRPGAARGARRPRRADHGVDRRPQPADRRRSRRSGSGPARTARPSPSPICGPARRRPGSSTARDRCSASRGSSTRPGCRCGRCGCRSRRLSAPVIDAVRLYDPRGARVQIWRRTLSPDTGLPVGVPEPWFKGFCNKAPIPRPEPGGEAILEMEVVSTTRLVAIPNGRRKSDAAQRSRDPDDRFRRYKAIARTIDVPWGEKDGRRGDDPRDDRPMTRLPDWRSRLARLPRRRAREAVRLRRARLRPLCRRRGRGGHRQSIRAPPSASATRRWPAAAGRSRARGYRDPVAFVRERFAEIPVAFARAGDLAVLDTAAVRRSPWSAAPRSSRPPPSAASSCCRSPPPSPPSGSEPMPPVGAAIGAAFTGLGASISTALTGAAFSGFAARAFAQIAVGVDVLGGQPDAAAEAEARDARGADQRRLRRGRAGDDHPRPLRHRRRPGLCRQLRPQQRHLRAGARARRPAGEAAPGDGQRRMGHPLGHREARRPRRRRVPQQEGRGHPLDQGLRRPADHGELLPPRQLRRRSGPAVAGRHGRPGHPLCGGLGDVQSEDPPRRAGAACSSSTARGSTTRGGTARSAAPGRSAGAIPRPGAASAIRPTRTRSSRSTTSCSGCATR